MVFGLDKDGTHVTSSDKSSQKENDNISTARDNKSAEDDIANSNNAGILKMKQTILRPSKIAIKLQYKNITIDLFNSRSWRKQYGRFSG